MPRPSHIERSSRLDSPYEIESPFPVTPQYRSLVAVDIEGSTSRTNVERARVRRVMYDLLEAALRSVGIDNSYRDKLVDRGDGILALVHPVNQAPKTLLLANLMPALSILLARHNARHADSRPLRMRAAMHAGEAHYDEYNCFGEAIDLCCRLLDAQDLKKQFGQTDAPLILVVSQDIYRSVVRHGYDGIDVADFAPLVHVHMAGQRHEGWVSVPEANIPKQSVRPVTDLGSRR